MSGCTRWLALVVGLVGAGCSQSPGPAADQRLKDTVAVENGSAVEKTTPSGRAAEGAANENGSAAQKVPAAASPIDAGAAVADAGGVPAMGPGRAEPVLPGGPRVFSGHTEPLLAIALSPDGTLMATGGLDHTVRLWDLSANAQRGAFSGMKAEVTALAFSPDGHWLAIGDRGFEVRLVRLSDLSVAHSALHPEGVAWLEFSPDSKWLGVAGANGTAQVLATDTGVTRCEVRGRSVSFSRDGKTVITGMSSGQLTVSDAVTGKVLKSVPTAPHLPYASTAGDQTLVLTRNGDENDVRVWNLKTGKQTGALKGHTAGVTSVSLTGDGAQALTGSADLSLRLWDLKSLKTVKTFSVDRLPFGAISRDGKVVAATDGLKARVWELR